MKKTILIGALAPLEGLVDDANPVVVIVNLKTFRKEERKRSMTG